MIDKKRSKHKGVKGVSRWIKDKIKRPVQKACDYICDYNRALVMASVINKDLEKYKGINKGKNIFIFGGGPSIKNFIHEKEEEEIYIGVNRSYKDVRFEFDYLFAQDQLEEGFDEFLGYRGNMCKKFLAIIPSNESFRIKEYALQGEYERYVLASRRMKSVPIDISLEPFADLRGTVFSALQFAVYTNPHNIYLVGIDCSSSNNVYNTNDDDYRYQLEGWKIMKNALIELGAYDRITSINPVGLKGFFNDMYTNKAEK